MRTMKKIFVLAAVMLMAFCSIAFAGEKKVDLRDYQQAAGTVNVLATSFDGVDSYIATFNFDRTQNANKINYYQGTCIVDQNNDKVLQPLLVKKITGNEKQFSEVILDKIGNAPYKQDYRRVQTNDDSPALYVGADANRILLTTDKASVSTNAGTFDDCIAIKIYNEETGEGMVQYLAKGYGVVYLEGLKSDGSKVEIAKLQETRPLDNTEIESFKTKYFV